MGSGMEQDTSAFGLCWWSYITGWKHMYYKENIGALLDARRVGNAEKTKYVMYCITRMWDKII